MLSPHYLAIMDPYFSAYSKEARKTESNEFGSIIKRLSEQKTVRLLHGSLGLATEAGEFLDTVKKHFFYGKEIDQDNLVEEIGDIVWYLSILLDVLETPISEVCRTNLLKLSSRYGEKFSSDSAINRDVSKEYESAGWNNAQQKKSEDKVRPSTD